MCKVMVCWSVLLVVAFGPGVAYAPPPPAGLVIPGRVIKVYDGDTWTVEYTITLRANIRSRVCSAPELNQRGGVQAMANLKHHALGKEGHIIIPFDNADNIGDLLSFGRVVGDFHVHGMGRTVSEQQIEDGVAKKIEEWQQ